VAYNSKQMAAHGGSIVADGLMMESYVINSTKGMTTARLAQPLVQLELVEDVPACDRRPMPMI
jgi:hypothetical protein